MSGLTNLKRRMELVREREVAMLRKKQISNVDAMRLYSILDELYKNDYTKYSDDQMSPIAVAMFGFADEDHKAMKELMVHLQNIFEGEYDDG